MSDAIEPRRSGRRTIRPVEFWNFEKPDDSKSEKIIYNLNDLSRCSIYDVWSTKYLNETRNKSVVSEKSKISVNKKSKTKHTDDRHEKVYWKRKSLSRIDDVQPKRLKIKEKKITSQKKPGVDKKKLSKSVTFNIPKGRKKKNESKQISQMEAETTDLGDEKVSQQQDVSSATSAMSSDELPNKSREWRSVQMDSLTARGGNISNASQDQTAYEQPSFQNILCSTVVDPSFTLHVEQNKGLSVPSETSNVGSVEGTFKKPNFLAHRWRKKKAVVTEPSMVSIPEESELVVSEENVTVAVSTSSVGLPYNHIKKQPISKSFQEPYVGDEYKHQEEKKGENMHPKENEENILPDHSILASVLDAPTNATTNGCDSVPTRRSRRIRTKPLEFWNFETVEVKTSENGEVSVIHHKQEIPPSKRHQKKEKNATSNPVLNCSVNQNTVGESHEKPSPSCNILEKPADVEVGNLLKHTSEKEDRIRMSKAEKFQDMNISQKEDRTRMSKTVKFEDLKFFQINKKDCFYYVAKSCQDINLDVHAGFMFLQQGQIVWNPTKETILYVMEGCGVLHVLEGDGEGIVIYLRQSTHTSIAVGKKVAVKKDGRCKMLKLFVVLSSAGKPTIVPEETSL